jgi:hypothetical protein
MAATVVSVCLPELSPTDTYVHAMPRRMLDQTRQHAYHAEDVTMVRWVVV